MKLILGNCIEELKKLKEDSVDSIVTDPPYELGFMGKKWDASGIAYNVELWKECLRVLKAGGHLLSFGGTRTYHRMTCAIEDAGFEIRDMLEWIYASGFPKSQNVGKAYDKRGGKNLSWFIDYILKIADEKGISKKELTMLFPSKNGKPTGWLWNKQKIQGLTLEQYHKIKDFLELPFDNIDELEREVVGKGKAGLTKGTIANFSGETEFDLTKGNSQWEGFGTALKPAHEPIVLARKPLSEKTIVENCIKHGTGALDIDGCRIPTSDTVGARPSNKDGITRRNLAFGMKEFEGNPTQGRFPANLLVTDDALNDGEMTKSHGGGKASYGGSFGNNKEITDKTAMKRFSNDSGSKSRYFDIDVWGEKHGLIQTPKASKSERNKGCEGMEHKRHSDRKKDDGAGGDNPRNRTNTLKQNFHPTVKPLHLMSWLVRLVSKKGDTVLDPFMGSGTTGVACKQLDRNFIGIEREEEYIKIAEARIKAVPQTLI
jgi:DNA modification methylase